MRSTHRRIPCARMTVMVATGLISWACSSDPDPGGSINSAAAADASGGGGICKATEACPCDDNSQCESGICIEGPDGTKRCAKPCEGGCEDGWECKEFGASESAVYVCVPTPKPECIPTLEQCDGEDNDCDGETDETFCDDGNPCTDDVCDPKLAVDGALGCTAVNIDIPCDDNNLCTTGDTCSAGSCKSGTAKDCNDFNSCTVDACDLPTGECTNTVIEGPCDDGSACTVGDVCIAGACAPGPPPDCDDSNPCTDDLCDPQDGCKNPDNSSPCEDGDLCTQGDTCTQGKCASAPPIDCDDNNECTKNFCDPALVSDLSNGCTHTDITDICSDGEDCTVGDVCSGGKCIAGAPKTCDDNKPCTVDGCDSHGNCVNAVNPDSLACDDGDACTTDDTCNHAGDCLGTGTKCDDNEPCTVDSCDTNTGKCVYENNSGASCSDGDNCSLGDKCQGGKCLSGQLKLCDDGLACTNDACDQTTGECSFVNNASACDDNNPCTLSDKCSAGKCAGTLKDAASCSDGNGCTVDSCDPATGKCSNKNTANGVICQDADQCTQGDSCQKGACTAGPSVYCSDNNPCTDDSCNATSGTCEHTNNTAACDDGNKCTSDDACAAGKCSGGKNACECQKDADCASKEDGNLCNGTLFCESGSNTCKVNTSTIAVCDKSKDTECAAFSCSPKNGVCEAIAKQDNIPCDADGSVCTNGDACSNGVCKPGAAVVCDDYNPCTDDACDPKAGCKNTDNKAVCFDGDHCTSNDLCANGSCVAGPQKKPCDDTDPCTSDKCNPLTGNCQFTPLSGAGCTDGNACTTGDICVAGACEPTGVKPACDDGNPCTIDVCNGATGNCDAKPGFDGLSCEDGNQCTNGDYCLSGKCQAGSVLGCLEGGPCNIGSCNVATGKCAYQPTNNNGKCNDGDACSLEDVCNNGKCVPKDNKPCNDNNICTADICNKVTGKCEYKPGTDGLLCNDGDLCSFGDACTAGKCTPKSFAKCDDNNQCTNDSCNKSNGKCVYAPAPLKPFIPCDDNNACTRNWWYYTQAGKWGDVCYQGKCHGHNINCNDSNPCTDDSCDTTKGCVHVTVFTRPCNDGNACTTGDSCKSGTCRGAGKTCSDGNPCTNDSCNTKSGCVFSSHNGGCDDGNVCTTSSSCSGGKCVGTAQLDCDDKLVCTDDSCHPKNGCQNVPDDKNPCDDGDKCLTGEACKAGKCAPGTVKTNCDDGNVCTTASCDSALGCQYVDNGDKPCDDNNVCTNPDACKNGKCFSTGANTCDDANECTIDSCHPVNGCVNTNFNGTCSDGDACTQGDHCDAGKCQVNGPLNCDDATKCTDDSCDKTEGCKHDPVKGISQAKLALNSDVQAKSYTKTKDFGGKAVPEDIEPAVLADTAHGSWKAVIAGAKWVWRTAKPQTPTADETIWFVREFAVPSGATDVKATLQVAADDSFACTLNGKAVASGSVNVVTTDISGGVNVGENTLICKVDNKGVAGATAATNPAGLLFGIALDFKLDKVLCSDGNVCTALDVCELGQCVGSNGQNCNDGNSCTGDSCDPAIGCTHKSLDGVDCNDGDDCTLQDKCTSGKCVALAKNNCDDGNGCTEDTCNTVGGCKSEPRKVGDKQDLSVGSGTSTLVTTTKNVGGNGLPVPTNLQQAVEFGAPNIAWAVVPGAKWIWHSKALADPTKSETAYFQQDLKLPAKAETLRGTLHIAADNAFECYLNGKLVGVSDKNANAYTKAVQLNLAGALKGGDNRLICAVHNVSKATDTAQTNTAGMAWRVEASWYKPGESPACDDKNSCTSEDACFLGKCHAGGPTNCDDDNACTDDSCDVKSGCEHKVATNPCNDGSVCTAEDYCKDGKCEGKTNINCEDGNSCTDNLCHAQSGCFGEAKADGATCDDDNVCTGATTCAAGVCKNGKPSACDDKNSCTADVCFPLVGCTYKPVDDQACNDDDSCTIDDICKNGQCLGKKGNLCDDGNACTDDGCTTAGGCTHKPGNGSPCDDGNVCTIKDSCQEGVCTSGGNKDCIDSEQCTSDLCDAKTGKCVFAPISDGECDDGNLCTLNDKCNTGKCVAGASPPCSDGNTCTTDNCDPTSGKCQHDPIASGTSCDDGNACTLGDRCDGLKCAGAGKECDDSNDCTADTCNPATGVCKHSAVADGAICQVVGKCKAGACLIK